MAKSVTTPAEKWHPPIRDNVMLPPAANVTAEILVRRFWVKIGQNPVSGTSLIARLCDSTMQHEKRRLTINVLILG